MKVIITRTTTRKGRPISYATFYLHDHTPAVREQTWADILAWCEGNLTPGLWHTHSVSPKKSFASMFVYETAEAVALKLRWDSAPV